jgi:hypothetical protein
MQSKITIEVDFENGNEPVIQIVSRNTDDIRDKLIKSFLQSLGGNSWCKIYCEAASTHDEPDRQFQRWKISAIKPSGLKTEAETMIEQHRLNEFHTTGVLR